MSRKPAQKYRSERDAKYQQYISSPQWRSFRDRIKAERGECECCGSGMNLQVHHLHYDTLGRESDSDVALLCIECHEAVHGRFDALKRRLTLGPILDKKDQVAAWQKRLADTPSAKAKAERRERAAAYLADVNVVSVRYAGARRRVAGVA